MISRRYQLKVSSGTLYRVAIFRTDVSEKVLPPSSGILRLIEPMNMEGLRSPKRRFEIVLHGTKSQETPFMF
jgi:hypothetical protein